MLYVKCDMKIVFWGSSEFAVLALQALPKAGFSVNLVVTQPDAPKGRFLRLEACPVAKTAKELGFPLFQPERLKLEETLARIKEAGADLFVVAAYGRIIPENILNLAFRGTINIHPSLLPKYRGPSPIQSAILNGETETGASIMLLDKEMDHGPLLAQKTVSIQPATTAPKLEQILSILGAELLVATLPRYLAGEIQPVPQDHTKATICKMLTREDGKINWPEPAEVIERKIRAFEPWPGTYTHFGSPEKSELLKILKATVVAGKNEPGLIGRDGTIGTGQDLLKLELVQPAGKNPMAFRDFLRGHQQLVDTRFFKLN